MSFPALADYLDDKKMEHVRGAPYHPMTQGKIEHWHRLLKNFIMLHHYYTPSQLRVAIGEFIEYYNNRRYHESLDNMTPVSIYYGKQKEVQSKRDKIKRKTMALRRQQNLISVGV